MNRSVVGSGMAALALVAGGLVTLMGPAWADSPCSVTDSNSGLTYNTSLQEAVDAAVAAGEFPDTLSVSGTCVGDTTIDIGPEALTIDGASGATLDGQNNADNRGSVLTVISGTVTISDLTITNGYSDNLGGGILNEGIMTLAGKTTVTGNTGSSGGGIYSDTGSLTLVGHTKVTNNIAADGAGIFVYDGFLTLTDHSSVTNNQAVIPYLAEAEGGGIFNVVAQVTLAGHSTVTHNTADYGGGYAQAAAGSLLTQTDHGRVTGNTAWIEGDDYYYENLT